MDVCSKDRFLVWLVPLETPLPLETPFRKHVTLPEIQLVVPPIVTQHLSSRALILSGLKKMNTYWIYIETQTAQIPWEGRWPMIKRLVFMIGIWDGLLAPFIIQNKWVCRINSSVIKYIWGAAVEEFYVTSRQKKCWGNMSFFIQYMGPSGSAFTIGSCFPELWLRGGTSKHILFLAVR